MITTVDYNIDWTEHFYLDSGSPSGLCWNRDVLAGRNKFVRVSKGTPVGCLRKDGARVKAWTTKINGIPYSVHRVIWVMVYGSINPLLVVDHLNGDPLDNSIDNLALKTTQENAQNKAKSKNNTTGVNGVRLRFSREGSKLYVVSWPDRKNLNKSKCFSVNKYGSEEAFRLACEYRTAQIALLNENGANYTERHGSA